MTELATTIEPTDDRGAAVICPKLHHTGNFTAQPEEMLRWYRNVLGQLPVVAARPPAMPIPGVFTTNDNAHHRMGFFSPAGIAGKASTTTPGVQHTAWEYDSIDGLLESWERLVALDIKPVYCVDHGMSVAFYYTDPDGSQVELLADAYGDHDASLAAIASEAFAANPPGTAVDPAQMLAARRGGMSLGELHERAYAGEFAPEHAITHDVPRDRQVNE